MGQIIAVANQKGGVGKTTTAVNLSWALALAGRAVLLVDFDPQSNATSGLGVAYDSRPPQSHYLITGERPIAWVPSRLEHLSVLPAAPSLQAVGKILAAAPDRDFRLKRSLGPEREAFEFVIIDCPPSFSLFTTNALVAADSVLVPLQCEYFAMEGLAQMAAVIQSVKRGANPALEMYGILLTMFDDGVAINRDVAAEVRGHFPVEVLETVIVRDEALTEASSHARTIFEYAPRSRAAFAYACLAREVLSDERKEIGSRI